MIVERQIPYEVLCKLGGEYSISGGTIRVSSGFKNAGSIVKHLRFPENYEATNEIFRNLNSSIQKNIGNKSTQNIDLLSSIQSLQHATIMLQGMNLAVSAIGFTIVISQLNKISKKLDLINENIESLQLTTNQIRAYQELIQLSRYTANLETLCCGLRLSNLHLIYSAITNLRESQYLCQAVCENQLADIKELYQNSNSFQIHFLAALASAMCIANAHAQCEEFAEAEKVITDIKNWQNTIKYLLKKPLKKPLNYLWLGRLSDNEKKQTKILINTQQCIPENLKYLSDTYNLYQKKGGDLQRLIAENPNSLYVIDP